MTSENFTISDIEDDFFIENVLIDVVRRFVELDGYYELENIGKEKPVSREDWIAKNG